MGEVLYEKKYPKESPEDLEELQNSLTPKKLRSMKCPR